MDDIKISVNFKIKNNTISKNDNPKVSRYNYCVQSINMTKEAYYYMINNITNNISNSHWKRLSNHRRIEEHLKGLQHDLKAASFEFTIFED